MTKMKKNIFIVLTLLIVTISMHAKTAESGLSYTGTWLNNNDSIAVGASGYFTITMTKHTSEYKGWKVIGDLLIESGDSTATSARIRSTGPGKGRIYYYYDDNPSADCKCGIKAVSLNVYKSFSPSAYNIDISGPDCILAGDTVVYSIDPILTKNLTQGIGVDEYFWQFSSGLVQEHIYHAGDNSSVTFVVGQVSGNDSIGVQVGIANGSSKVYKPLRKAAPKPTINPICVPYGVASVQISVAEPVENVVYSWTCSDDEWGFKPQIGSEVSLIPGNTSSPTITVTAYFEGGETCSASQTTMKVARSWANNVSVTSDTVPYRFGHEYNFNVTGGVTGGGLSWTPPTGWAITYKDGKEVTMRPDNSDSVKLHDSLFVEAILTCAEQGVDRRKYDVYVKPAKATSITDNGCLITDTIYKFKITAWESGPKASTYKWLVDGIEQNSYEGDSLVWKAALGAQTISVIPRGAMYAEGQYYWGDTATFALTFQPTAPDSIIPSDTCLFSQREIETTLHVQTPIPGQTYHWTYIPGWSITSDELDSSIVTYSASNTLSGSYPVSVYASGEGNCSTSNQNTYTIKVKDIPYSIVFTDMGELYPMFEGNYGFSLNIATDSAIWKVGTTNYGKRRSITLPYIPQEVIAIVEIQGCTKEITWSQDQINTHRGNLINKRKSLSEDFSFSIFPNPAKSEVYLQLEDNKQYTLYIVDAKGTLVSTELVKDTHSPINTSSLPNGNYFFILANNENKKVCPILIQH